jgi:eukaryotic-like serine/threonine-protein kinase
MDTSHAISCPRCGRPVPPDAPEGLCPACAAKALRQLGDRPAPTDPAATALPPPTDASSGSDFPRLRQLLLNVKPRFGPGDALGPYRIHRLLGRGAMGEVYDAQHREIGRRVALKVLNEGFDSDEDRARFLDEGRSAAKIRHPNSVCVFGAEVIDHTPVIVMELLGGGTLKRLVQQRGALPPAEAVDAMLQVIAGLQAAETANVLHKDLKPSNCFVDQDGRTVKVGDFGLSIPLHSRPGAGSDTVYFEGTPEFAAPEHLRGETLDVRADVYSVGATLFFLLTGHAPFEYADGDEADESNDAFCRRVEQEPVPSARAVNPAVPRGLDAIVAQCLGKHAWSRPTYALLATSLAPFRSITTAPASIARRFGASAIDVAIVLLLAGFVAPILLFSHLVTSPVAIFALAIAIPAIPYRMVLEGAWGATVGLLATRLRVVRPGAGPPGFFRALVRELVASLPFAACLVLVALASHREVLTQSFRFTLAGVFVLGQVLLYALARRTNGLASLQDLFTGTRVITRAPALARAQPSASSGPSQTDPERPSDERRRIGPYEVLRPLGPTDAGQLYVGLDAHLARRVWIHEPTNGATGKFAVDPSGYRRARLPWFNGRTGPDAFDAYELQDGEPLLDRTTPLPVADVCRAMRDLADQIAIELATGGLVSPLGLDRLWVTDDHRVRLLDFRPPMRTGAPPVFTLAEPVTTRTAQRFLHAAALRAIDPPSAAVSSARLLPFWASDAFDRLARGEFLTLPDVVTTFRRLDDEPDRVASALRAAGVVVNAIVSYAGFVLFRNLFPHASPSTRVAAAVVLCMTLAVFWAALLRGGFWLTVFRIGVARRDGRPVSRTRAAIRALCGYGLAALPFAHIVPAQGLLILVVLAGMLWTVIRPARGPQDWLLNTYLVPR